MRGIDREIVGGYDLIMEPKSMRGFSFLFIEGKICNYKSSLMTRK